MFAASGARRTSTAFDRFVAWTKPGEIQTGGSSQERPVAERLPAVKALPEVRDSIRLVTPLVSEFTLPGNRVVHPPELNVFAIADPRVGTSVFRIKVLHGRLP